MSGTALPPVHGHADVRATLASAAVAGSLAQSILLHGPAGIGKERLALWIAQLVVCQAPTAAGGCGECQPCRMALKLEHPDVHWFFPLPRPDASQPEKLREKLEEARYAELSARRTDPFHVPAYEKPPAYFLGTIQNLQKLAGMRPAMGSRKVFVVGDAELMVPQESSQEAANAFLKLLEEPPADTTLVLTASSPGALLPTIRSRVLPVRLLPLAADDVQAFLVNERGMAADEARALAGISRGAIGRALRLAPQGGGAGVLAKRREAGKSLLFAALAESPSMRFAAAHGVPPAGARGEFTDNLEALAEWLRDLLAVAAGAPDQVAYTGEARLLEKMLERRPVRPEGVARSIMRVQEAQELAAGNVNPQLIVSTLLRGIRTDLVG
ncbi:MAG: polymerase delta subunit [Gemmatimonadetes bacterium]|nr:polymerase delta subunit [Gemmatimonadota bacterium]